MRVIVLTSHRLCVGVLASTDGYLASQLTTRELMNTSFIRGPKIFCRQLT